MGFNLGHWLRLGVVSLFLVCLKFRFENNCVARGASRVKAGALNLMHAVLGGRHLFFAVLALLDLLRY